MSENQVSDAVVRWVTFRLGDETYGVNVMQVQEVLRVTDIAPVPGAPGYVLGIINLRGNVVTVIDTRNRFGMSPKEINDASRIIIIEANEQTIGMLVDSVAEVVDIQMSQVESTPHVGNDESAKYIQGVTSRNNQLLILVDLNKFLQDESMSEMEFF